MTELIQTEINHVRTIKLVLGIYVRELRETLQMDETQLERLFPQVDSLLQVHQLFLNRLKQRRIDSLEPGSTQNYCIHRIGDILMTQVSLLCICCRIPKCLKVLGINSKLYNKDQLLTWIRL